MRNIEELTDSDVVINMLELAGYLAMQNDDSNQIELKINNLNMKFEAWTDDCEE